MVALTEDVSSRVGDLEELRDAFWATGPEFSGGALAPDILALLRMLQAASPGECASPSAVGEAFTTLRSAKPSYMYDKLMAS